ncbi:hypothetical protein A7K91_04935 [Paenibacillus oryzae]|uniref:Uncharacterized protein n=1 Tax=Paenibacillus oryzae TaxID=1844972 RepID=A0A1A5YH98_9BACL|nr:hypothetical protein [Paenibacillus oryzae]OBR64928.1 hypothetical protein A7K91_04935 [Paenibacillus oryzae]
MAGTRGFAGLRGEQIRKGVLRDSHFSEEHKINKNKVDVVWSDHHGMTEEALALIKELRDDLDALDIDSDAMRDIIATAEQANFNAANAINTADNAFSQATNAMSKANSASSLAESLNAQISTASGKADTALVKTLSVESSLIGMNTKVTAADAKAQSALDRTAALEEWMSESTSNATELAQTAMERASEAHLIASNVQSSYNIDIPVVKSDVVLAKSTATKANHTADIAYAMASAVEEALENLPTPVEGDVTTDQLYNQLLITDAKATEAKNKAELALTTANGVDNKAEEALARVMSLEGDFASTSNNSSAAIIMANETKSLVNGLSIELNTKVNSAVSKADAAKSAADLARVKANGFEDDITKANANASKSLIMATAAKDTADSMSGSLSSAVSDASRALSQASSADTKSDTALTRATSSETIANQAKNIANSVDGKADQALSNSAASLVIANEAKNVADGVDGKAAQAQLVAASAKEIAEGLDEKATQAMNDADDALTVARSAASLSQWAENIAIEARNTANGIDAKASQAKSDSSTAVSSATMARTTADNARSVANIASQVASASDDKAEEALLKAQESIDQFKQFSLKPAVQGKDDLPAEANVLDDIRIVKDENKFYRYTATGWIPVGIAEEEMTTIRKLIDDMSEAAAPYYSIKQRLDALEGYIRNWSLETQTDFDRGTYEGTIFNGGVVLAKRMLKSVDDHYGDLDELAWNTVDLRSNGLPMLTESVTGAGGGFLQGYSSHMDYSDLEAILSFSLHGKMQEVYFGFHMNADLTSGYLLSFKRNLGRDRDGSIYGNVIEIFKIKSGDYEKLTSLNYILLENQPYVFKLHMDGSNITVWRDTIKLIDIMDESYTSGKFSFYDVSRKNKIGLTSRDLGTGTVGESTDISTGMMEIQAVEAYSSTALGDVAIQSDMTGVNTCARIISITDDLLTVTADESKLGKYGGDFEIGDTVIVHVSGGTDRAVIGNYGRLKITHVNGRDFTLSEPIGGIITKAQLPACILQMVKVVSFSNLVVKSGATVSPVPYDGTVGGILAIDVSGTLQVDGTISATGKGFYYGAASPTNGRIGSGSASGTNYVGSGGGGGANQFSGGAGGRSPSVGNGGIGGVGLGAIDLTKRMTFGGAGGSGSPHSGVTNPRSTGGGIVYITCQVLDITNGEINSHGTADGTLWGLPGAGGGAGGTAIIHAVLIKGMTDYKVGCNASGGTGNLSGTGTPPVFRAPTNTAAGNGQPGWWSGAIRGTASGGFRCNGGGGGAQAGSNATIAAGAANATAGGAGGTSNSNCWGGGGGGGGGYIAIFSDTIYRNIVWPEPTISSAYLRGMLALWNDGGQLKKVHEGKWQEVAVLPLSDTELIEVLENHGMRSLAAINSKLLREVSHKGVVTYTDIPSQSLHIKVTDKLPLELHAQAGLYTKNEGWYRSSVLDSGYLCRFTTMDAQITSDGQQYNIQTRTFINGNWSEWSDLNADSTVLSPEGTRFQFQFYSKTADGIASAMLDKATVNYTISDKEIMDASLYKVAEDLKQTKIAIAKMIFHNTAITMGQREKFNNIVIERFDGTTYLESMDNVGINSNGELALLNPSQSGSVVLDTVLLPEYSYYTMVTAEFEGDVSVQLSYDYAGFILSEFNSKMYNMENATGVRVKLFLEAGTTTKVLSTAVLV